MTTMTPDEMRTEGETIRGSQAEPWSDTRDLRGTYWEVEAEMCERLDNIVTLLTTQNSLLSDILDALSPI